MPEATATGSQIIHAPAQRVYAIIADYRVHHPRIVPPEYFRKVEVEFHVRSGPFGAIERAVTAAMLRRIYRKELARLEQYTTQLPLAQAGDSN